MNRVILIVLAAVLSGPAYGWDGTDTETGASIEFGKGNLVREGRDIEIYDNETGDYRDVTIEDINRRASRSKCTTTKAASTAPSRWKTTDCPLSALMCNDIA